VRLLGRDGTDVLTAPTAGASVWPAGGKLFCVSLGLAACSTLCALALAFPVGIHLGTTDRLWPLALALVPIIIPPHLAAYLWRFTLNDVARFLAGSAAWRLSPRWNFLGATWTLAGLYWPVIALPIALSMRLRGNRLRQELATLAAPRPVFWGAVVPGLAPGLVAGAGVFFLLALSNYGVPLMWSVPSQNVAVFARLVAYYTAREALMLSLPLVATALAVCCAGLFWLTRKPYGSDLGLATVPRIGALRAAPRGLVAWSGLVLLATSITPVITLVAGTGVFERLRANLINGASPFLWGLALAALGASGATAAGLSLAQVTRHAPRFFRGLVEFIGLSALFLPAAVICLALAGLLSVSGPLGALQDSVGVFVIAYGVRFFYIPWKIVRFVQGFEGREHEDVKRILGLGRLARARLAAGGTLRPALYVSWLVVFAFALGELEIATRFVQPGRQPISVFLDNLLHYGRFAEIGQWSLIVLVSGVVIVWTVLWIGLAQWRRLRVTA